MAEAKHIGRTARSKEGPRHVTGRGHFTDDFTLPGMLQAVILRSPHAHARIVNVDAAAARAAPGVFAIITPAEIRRKSRPFKPGRYAAGLKKPIPEYATAIDKARYVGEPIGALAARSRGAAEDAVELSAAEEEP